MQPTTWKSLHIIAAVHLTGIMVSKNDKVHNKGSYYADMLQIGMFCICTLLSAVLPDRIVQQAHHTQGCALPINCKLLVKACTSSHISQQLSI